MKPTLFLILSTCCAIPFFAADQSSYLTDSLPLTIKIKKEPRFYLT
jgi:hypothetical protein